MRIGIGYDIHQLIEGRPCIIGGIEVPHDKGLKGHSDADVLLHAITDAILGALALGDIGQHFPDTDPQNKGIRSSTMLQKAKTLVEQKGYAIGNIDSTVVCEKPKLKDHIPKMQSTIAECLQIQTQQVSVKATTNEKMGSLGRGEGIAALATVLLVPMK